MKNTSVFESEATKTFLSKSLGIILVVDNLKDTTPTEICRETYMTYSYVTKRLKDFEGYGIVKSSKVGRKRIYGLTKKGEIFVGHLRSVYNILRDIDLGDVVEKTGKTKNKKSKK